MDAFKETIEVALHRLGQSFPAAHFPEDLPRLVVASEGGRSQRVIRLDSDRCDALLHLAKVIEGVRFNDGIKVIEDRRAAA